MASSTPAPGLARKIKKILEITTESQDVLSSLDTLSSFYTENTAASRRALRTTIEWRGIHTNQQFLTAADTVIKAFDQMQLTLDGLSGSCAALTRVLSDTRASTSPLLVETDKMGKDLAALEHRQRLVADFLEHYQLAPEEVAALQGEEVGPAFFDALSRVRQLHDNCRALLRTHRQRAGLELMDMMAAYQETAYERLCRWVQAECRNIGEQDAPEVDDTLRAAVGALRQRPVLYKYCAEEVAAARHNALFQRFVTALTRGGPGGLPRPIEIHAADPKRYVNDMLAWVHQALASEREFITALFGSDDAAEDDSAHPGHPHQQQPQLRSQLSTSSGDPPSFTPTGSFSRGRPPPLQTGPSTSSPLAPPQPPAPGPDDEPPVHTGALLNRIFDSICRPLRVRVEQVLMMSPPLLLCFQLAQLLAFYHGMVAGILGPAAGLCAALAGCRDMASRTFGELLRAQGDKLMRNPPQPPKDLSPPQQFLDSLRQLHDLMDAHDMALQAEAADAADTAGLADGGGDNGFSAVLAAAVDPLMEVAGRSAEALRPDNPARLDDASKLDPSAHHIYVANCLSALYNCLAARPFAGGVAKRVAERIDAHIAAAAGGEAGRLLAKCGLAEVTDRIRLYQSAPSSGHRGSLGSDAALSLPAICDAMRAFFVAVSSPDALPEFAALQPPRLRAGAVARVAHALVEAYELVYATLDDPGSGYLDQGGAAGNVKHSPAQVRTILGVL